jgi:hypothetical protein
MNDGLSPEDSFRLQVLLAQDLKAIRIDESNLTLYALTDKGEASIPLAPNCRADKYLRQVRELLSGHALGSPGGYPVYLTRWTRHGQMEGLNLGKLLLTGEPEAVVAVVHSPGLTDDLARYAWWTLPTIENARLMLSREAVARGPMGRVLADFLVEHLPFLQDDHLGIIDTIAVLIYSKAVTPAGLETMWKWGRRSNTHYVAFLEMAAGNLPLPLAAHALHDEIETLLSREPHASAQVLQRALSSQGQTFLDAAAEILERPETQEVVSHTLNAIGRYFSEQIDLNALNSSVGTNWLSHTEILEAAARLAGCNDTLIQPIFARSTAIGSLMRRKIEPVLTPLLKDISVLRRS